MKKLVVEALEDVLKPKSEEQIQVALDNLVSKLGEFGLSKDNIIMVKAPSVPGGLKIQIRLWVMFMDPWGDKNDLSGLEISVYGNEKDAKEALACLIKNSFNSHVFYIKERLTSRYKISDILELISNWKENAAKNKEIILKTL